MASSLVEEMLVTKAKNSVYLKETYVALALFNLNGRQSLDRFINVLILLLRIIILLLSVWESARTEVFVLTVIAHAEKVFMENFVNIRLLLNRKELGISLRLLELLVLQLQLDSLQLVKKTMVDKYNFKAMHTQMAE